MAAMQSTMIENCSTNVKMKIVTNCTNQNNAIVLILEKERSKLWYKIKLK